MEKKREANLKKFISILCIFVLLQSYFSYFAQIAIATSEMVIGGEESSDSSENDEIVIGGEEEIQEEQNEDEQPMAESEEPVSEPEDTDEPVIGSEEELSAEPEDPQTEEPAEEPVIGEEEQEEPVKENEEQEQPVVEEEEPYVEPEITVEVTSENASIYKGYLYANATSELRYETNYNTIDVISIVGGKNITTLTVQDEPDKMQLITNTKIGLLSQMYYRQTRISVQEFNQLFGTDGSITLYTPEGEVLGYINKDTTIVNNEYVFTYPLQVNSVKFEFANIIADGTISIKNDKAIKESSDFSRNQISLFSSINTITAVNLYKGEEVKTYSAEGDINLEETESKMVIDIDQDTLSVEETNELAINVTLKTDEEKYDLFENPTIELEFPSAVEDIEVTGINLLYKNGLSIDTWNVTTNALGKKVLKVNLLGSQLEYTPGAVQEGTTVVVYADVDVNRLTADTSEALKMTYTNKDTVRKSYALEGKDSEDIQIDFVGRQELVRAMQITEANVATATSYDEQTEKIQILANQEQIVTITSSIVNNYEATLNDVVIVGRIPFVGNKDGNGNDLGTNFDTKLQNALATSGVIADIYYSEDGAAIQSSDSWSQDLENLGNYKSYKIVIREKTLAKGEKLSFEYSVVVPAEVGYNAVGYSNYVVYYKIDTQNYSNQCSVGMYTETKEVEMEDIEEENRQDVAVLTVGTQVSQAGKILGETDSVYERQVLKYTFVVRNTSNVTANNILIKANADNANLYYFKSFLHENVEGEGEDLIGNYEEDDGTKGYQEFAIDILAPGDSRTFEYQVIVKNLKEIENPEVYGRLMISADNVLEKEVNTFKNTIKEAQIEVRMGASGTESADDIDVVSDSAFQFKTYIKNISGQTLSNVDLIVYLPDSLEFFEIENIGEEFNEKIQKTADGSIVTIHFDELDADYENTIYFVSKVKRFDLNKVTITISLLSKIDINGEIYYSNDYSIKAKQTQSNYEYSWTSDLQKEILDHGDVITYTLKLKNIGVIDIDFTSITNQVPKGLKIEEVTLNTLEESKTLDYNDQASQVYEEINKIKVDEEIVFTIKTIVDENLFERDQGTIENKLTVNGGKYYDDFDTNVIAYKINNTSNVTAYRVSETVDDNNNNTNDTNNTNNENDINNTQEDNQINDQNIDNENNDMNNPQPQVNENTNIVDNTTVSRTYYVSGLAWIDINQDGIRQSSEQPKESVIVSLYKANSNGGIDTSSQIATTSTDSDGRYTFIGVEEGKYIVVFDYDSNKYKVTKYQVDTATSTENSDAVSKTITINGASQILGITDVLTVSNASLMSIDIGLVDKTNFDLSLEKAIASVTVKNDEGTKVYNYENGISERLEIRSKYYKSTVLDITYKFKVANEGEVSGYVNKVVDYLPDDVQVVLNSSPGWYIGSDNGLYYTGLVDEEISAGDAKEFTLVIRKSLANGEAVKLVNSAEIAEYTNAQGLFDKDSIENNQIPTEDDYGTATLIVSISTGYTAQYIATILIIIIMIASIVMMAIKFKNTKKVFR